MTPLFLPAVFFLTCSAAAARSCAASCSSRSHGAVQPAFLPASCTVWGGGVGGMPKAPNRSTRPPALFPSGVTASPSPPFKFLLGGQQPPVAPPRAADGSGSC